MATAIEYKAVLEPLEHLATQGFTVTLVKPEADGAVSAAAVQQGRVSTPADVSAGVDRWFWACSAAFLAV
jgi:hypothetical protein